MAIFAFSSCSLQTTEGLRLIEPLISEVENPYFSDPEKDYVYKAKIEVYGRNLGGILIIKKVGPEAHRVVFTTEFGSKLLDFQYEGDTFTKNFIVSELDKKMIVRTLERDFKLLVTDRANVMEAYTSERQSVYKTLAGKRFNYYFFSKETRRLEKIVNSSKIKEKITILFETSEKDIAQHIKIEHSDIKLKIELEIFKNN